MRREGFMVIDDPRNSQGMTKWITVLVAQAEYAQLKIRSLRVEAS
jgi:hypothetical protein